MKTQITILLLIPLILLGACTKSETSQVSEIQNNTPKGQASVVDNDSEKNILQVAISSEAHTTLVAAVQAAGIEHILVNAGPLTVFAPVNSAFENLPAGTVENLLKPENKDQLTKILTLHAAPGSYNIEFLRKTAEKGRQIYMATGDYLDIEIKGEDVFVGGAKVIASIQTSNGIVNVVDSVILPK